MLKITLWCLALFALCACATTAPTADHRGPTAETAAAKPTNTAAVSQPKTAASQPAPSAPAAIVPNSGNPAHALASRVAETAGAADLHELEQLDFHFVVKAGDKTLFSAAHRWALKAQFARIEWTNKEGQKIDSILDIALRTCTFRIDGAPAPNKGAEICKSSYGRYINDVYWLLLPLKLFDPGTNLELLDPIVLEGKQLQVLRISFDAVGLTPGDVYELYVDPASARITHWNMRLQGSQDKPRLVSWSDYRAVGPLKLAHDHVMADGKRVVFEAVRAAKTVDSAAFDFAP